MAPSTPWMSWAFTASPSTGTSGPSRSGPSAWISLRAEFGKPVWITETGVSSFASEDVASWGLRRSREILADERVYWYTLLDLDPDREATTRHKQAEGSSYFRHFHFGLLTHDGRPKKALNQFDPDLRDLPVVPVRRRARPRTRRSLAGAPRRASRSAPASAGPRATSPARIAGSTPSCPPSSPSNVCATLCFTPPSRGLRPDHTSPPVDVGEFAWFASQTAARYAAPSAPGRGAEETLAPVVLLDR